MLFARYASLFDTLFASKFFLHTTRSPCFFRQTQRHAIKRRSSFSAITALVLFGGIGATLYSNHPAVAEEITGIIKAHNVTSQRLTLRNGAIFSVPSSVPSEALTVGSVVRVEFEEYGEYNDETVVTNIVPICDDVTALACRQFRNAQKNSRHR